MNHSTIIIFYAILIAVSLSSCSTIRNSASVGVQFRIDDVDVDKTGNYYLTDYRGEIRKYSDDNKMQYSYKNYNTGPIASVDVTNPHKILVFFRDFQTLMLLDNTLSSIKTIKLNPLEYYTAAGTSNDGSIWLYNSVRNTINKISFDGSVFLESIPLRRFAPGSITDAKITERENMLYINDANHGILLFNNLGIFSRIVPLTTASGIQIINNTIYYLDTATYQFAAYDLSLNTKATVVGLNEYQPKAAKVYGNKIFMIRNNTLDIFSLEKGELINQ
jgi:hypothetical protein